MKAMDKIYIVTSGEYSDYSLEGVFTDFEMAKKFIDNILNEWDARIETHEVNPYQKQIKEGLSFYKVEIHKNGEVDHVERGYVWFYDGGKHRFLYDREDEVYILQIFTWAKSENHAIKIANEKRAQLVANNRWGKAENEL